MKTTIKLFTLAFVALFAVSCNNNDEYDMLNSLWRNVTQNEARIDDLEKWCSQANTNITSLQTIVNVIESNDVVTSVTPIMENGVEIGYTITFADHDPITIYHGKDGKDGQNGANGQNGVSPVVGVAKYTDGVYYWTLNGEWLLDENGNKLRVSGEDGKDGKDGEDGVDGADGKDGENGKDGADGQNGTNGQNGITPQLKIEADYWWISYDNGNTWTQLGKAKGDKGDKGDTGAAGTDGQDGDSMFQSVTQDAANVYFTLADGTLITIAKGGGGSDDGGYIFTITYMPNGGEGEMKVDTVRYGCSYTIKSCTFTYPAYGFVEWNTAADGKGIAYITAESIMLMKNIILYAQWSDCAENGYVWIDLGLSVKWATYNVGALSPIESGDYFAWGETKTKSSYTYSTYTYSSNPSILPLNCDAAHVNWGGSWRMPTSDEYKELRNNCVLTWTNNYNGITGVSGRIVTSKINGKSIFLPAAGYRENTDLLNAGTHGHYRVSSLDENKYVDSFRFTSSSFMYYAYDTSYWGQPVRAVLK